MMELGNPLMPACRDMELVRLILRHQQHVTGWLAIVFQGETAHANHGFFSVVWRKRQ